MKGTIGFFILSYIINTAGAAIIKTPPEDGKVLIFGMPSQLLLSCEVDPSATFTDFKWTAGIGSQKPTELCKAATQEKECTVGGDASSSFETKDPKYNLHVTTDKTVSFLHAGTFSCELTANSETEKKTGDITVVANTVSCDSAKLPKDVKGLIMCSIDYKGAQAPTLTIGGNEAVMKDRNTGDDGVKTRDAIVEIIPTADTSYECRYNDFIGCTISVKTFPTKVATHPEPVTWAKVNTAATIPCTMKPNQVYAKATWLRLDSEASPTQICSGSMSNAGTCQTKGYSLDDTKKHDLTIQNATTAYVFMYSCYVEATEMGDEVENYFTQLAVVKDPICQAVTKDNEPWLSCSIEYKGTDERPTMKWFDGTTEVTMSTTDAVSYNSDWKKVTLTAPLEKATTEYVCKVFRDTTATTEIASCKQTGASAASAFGAKFLQSTLLSLGVVLMLSQFK